MELNYIKHIDALLGLQGLPSNSIDCIITSPPYYQLRDYHNEKQIGLEGSVEEYIKKLKVIFIESQRVMKDDATMFIVIGDTYNGSKIGKTDNKYNYLCEQDIKKKKIKSIGRKSLLGIPSRLEIALIDSGLILRNEIIWHKPNAMPSSVKDRFSIDYEKILFFTKNEKYYFKQLTELMKTTDLTSPRGSKEIIGAANSGRRKQDLLGKQTYTGFNDRYNPNNNLERNMRCIWQIPTHPSSIEHYAMFPEKLVERLVECGCKKGGIILDMFMGSGTTGVVARKMNRDFIGFELNETYAMEAQIRTMAQPRTPSIFDFIEED